jgi:hypothetical protein
MSRRLSMRKEISLFLVFSVLNVSCATIIRGTSQEIPVTSNPIGAKIILDGDEMGITPLNLRFKRKRNHVIQIEKQGFNPFMIRTTSNISLLSTLGNIVPWGYPLGGLLGFSLGMWLTQDDDDFGEGLGKIGTGAILGIILGWGFAVWVDSSSGAKYSLFPKELNVTLTKIGKDTQPDFIIIDAEKFQDIKWIRIKCDDSGGYCQLDCVKLASSRFCSTGK